MFVMRELGGGVWVVVFGLVVMGDVIVVSDYDIFFVFVLSVIWDDCVWVL